MTTPGMGARVLHGFTEETFKQHSRDTIDAYMPLVSDVFAELAVATAKFAAMRSMHEGWAILREEVDELWEDVKADRWPEAAAEARQVAAMALRFIHDMQALRAAEAGE